MRILLVEDDPQIVGFVRKGLEEERYAVDVATDGEEALEMARVVPYDLIVLDVMLPKLDGFTVCRRLRAAGHGSPILLLTAKDAVEDRVTGLDTGADDYLTKPFAFAELLARLRALLRRAGSPQQTRLKVADLELDPVAHRVWRAGQEISLTNKEYGVLEFLLRNTNRALSRSAIIEHVWGIQYDSLTNIVDVQIRSLRSKLDRDPASALIHTVRGVGYMINAPEA